MFMDKNYWQVTAGALLISLSVVSYRYIAKPYQKQFEAIKKENSVLQKNITLLRTHVTQRKNGSDNILKNILAISKNDSIRVAKINAPVSNVNVLKLTLRGHYNNFIEWLSELNDFNWPLTINQLNITLAKNNADVLNIELTLENHH